MLAPRPIEVGGALRPFLDGVRIGRARVVHGREEEFRRLGPLVVHAGPPPAAVGGEDPEELVVGADLEDALVPRGDDDPPVRIVVPDRVDVEPVAFILDEIGAVRVHHLPEVPHADDRPRIAVELDHVVLHRVEPRPVHRHEQVPVRLLDHVVVLDPIGPDVPLLHDVPQPVDLHDPIRRSRDQIPVLQGLHRVHEGLQIGEVEIPAHRSLFVEHERDSAQEALVSRREGAQGPAGLHPIGGGCLDLDRREGVRKGGSGDEEGVGDTDAVLGQTDLHRVPGVGPEPEHRERVSAGGILRLPLDRPLVRRGEDGEGRDDRTAGLEPDLRREGRPPGRVRIHVHRAGEELVEGGAGGRPGRGIVVAGDQEHREGADGQESHGSHGSAGAGVHGSRLSRIGAPAPPRKNTRDCPGSSPALVGTTTAPARPDHPARPESPHRPPC